MSVSEPFIRRPIATSLLGIALMIGGALGYWGLPVSALPQVDFPTVQVTTQLPGASPDMVASLITASLERQIGQIPALQLMTSTSSYGVSQITLQFDLNRDIDGAAQDVQAAINAAAGDVAAQRCPIRRSTPRSTRRTRRSMTLALTSETVSLRTMSDIADTLLSQRLAEVAGVGRVTVHGGMRPAVRIQADLARLAAYGIGMEDLRAAIAAANVSRRQGLARRRAAGLHARRQRPDHRGQRLQAGDRRLSQRRAGQDLCDIAQHRRRARERQASAAWYQGTPAVVLDIQRQPGANVIDSVRADQARDSAAAASIAGGGQDHDRCRPHRHDPRLGP